ncbi:spindle and kinetochore-associated protein 1 [Thalassophryne amazonica]|uniref:spindle and kinetochore-associated protein 1 n=1 Tax=Thalassophryne amazonica TaxID=390379 RepID=UPI0014713D56|nr:spindle and kinetochore-associated protein 1 [Thalassophryne amazonica]
MSELESISCHIHDRISSIQRLLDLSLLDSPQNKMKKFGKELFELERLVDEFEKCRDRQKEQLKRLKEFEELFQKNLEDVQHLKDNVPAHMPRRKPGANENEPVSAENQAADVQPEKAKKPQKNHIREMEVITVQEFESIPQYMKGRVTYDQLNAAVQSINAAVMAKYKILHQPMKTLSSSSRKMYQQFKSQETEGTKGQYFVVEEDIREFTQMKVDKRFHGILSMLRHCQRLRELRRGGLTRYMLL